MGIKDPGCLWFLPLLLIVSLAAEGSDIRLVEAVKHQDNDSARSLLEQGTEVNSRQADGSTALMWAAYWDEIETAELLIQAGADVNAANEYGATSLWLACDRGSADMVEKLLGADADPNVSLHSGESPLMAAVETSVDAAKSLLAHGADVNAEEPSGGQTALMRAVAVRKSEAVKVLIEQGADVNAASYRGFTPLLFAVQKNDLESTRILLAAGADVNQASSETSPLLLALSSNFQALGALLLEQGADANAVDFRGYTSLHYAAERPNMGEMVKALLAHGADPDARIMKQAAQSESIPIIAVPFLRSPSRVILDGTKGGTIPIGATPMWLAAEVANVFAMRLLAEHGADWKLVTSENVFLEGGSGRRVNYMAGTTPLMMATGVGRVLGNWKEYLAEEEMQHLETVKLMVQLGADVNQANEYGFTPLHGAAYVGADRIIQFLMENGAKMDVLDNFGQTPVSIAEQIITAGLGDSLDARPRKYRKGTSDLLVSLGATPLAESDVQVLDHLIVDVEEPLQEQTQ